jgi:hypothetical protein
MARKETVPRAAKLESLVQSYRELLREPVGFTEEESRQLDRLRQLNHAAERDELDLQLQEADVQLRNAKVQRYRANTLYRIVARCVALALVVLAFVRPESVEPFSRLLSRLVPALASATSTSGRYWARTSDLRLVEAALSQLS